MTTGLIDANLQDVLVVFEEVPNVDLSVMCEQLQTARRELLNQLAIFVARLFVAARWFLEVGATRFSPVVAGQLCNPLTGQACGQ